MPLGLQESQREFAPCPIGAKPMHCIQTDPQRTLYVILEA